MSKSQKKTNIASPSQGASGQPTNQLNTFAQQMVDQNPAPVSQPPKQNPQLTVTLG